MLRKYRAGCHSYDNWLLCLLMTLPRGNIQYIDRKVRALKWSLEGPHGSYKCFLSCGLQGWQSNPGQLDRSIQFSSLLIRISWYTKAALRSRRAGTDSFWESALILSFPTLTNAVYVLWWERKPDWKVSKLLNCLKTIFFQGFYLEREDWGSVYNC